MLDRTDCRLYPTDRKMKDILMVAKRHANTIKAVDEAMLTVGQEVMVRDKQTNSTVRLNEWGLTEKQEEYAQGVAKGLSLRDAYCAAYDATKMQTTTIYTEASKLLDRPHVAARVKMLMEIRATRTHAVDAMRTRQHVFDRLMIESMEDSSPPAARIKALELLGKIDVVSMFKEQKGPALPEATDPKELEDKLRTMLTAMFGVAPPK